MRRVSTAALGLVGVVLVAAITATAINIPDSSAVSSASEEIQVSFTIEPPAGEPFADVTSPVTDSFSLSATGAATVSFSNATHVKIELTNKATNATTVIYDADTNALSGNIGAPYTLAGYGDYRVHAIATNGGSTTATADSDFVYGPVKTTIIDNGGGETTDSIVGDATIRVEFDDNTDSLDLSLVGDDGEVYTKHVDLTAEDKARGYVDVSLPVATEQIKNGTYTLATTANGADGQPLAPAYRQTLHIDILLPPKTGLFSGIDFSTLAGDYTILAVISLAAITIFTLVVVKRNRSEARR
jgi:hypothetical protein